MIFHSDCGTQGTSVAFVDVTNKLGIRRSAGRTGVCFGNARAESCNAAFKVERVNRTIRPTLEPACSDIARYIEFRYDTNVSTRDSGAGTLKRSTTST